MDSKMRNALEIINDNYSKFSKSQKIIASYIITHYDKAAFYTAAKLGKETNVSESTIVRFATKLGFEGYPEFQNNLHEIIQNRLTSVQRVEMAEEQLGKEDSFKKILEMDIERIRRTIESNSNEEIKTVADAIMSSKNIYIMGIRSSASLAEYMKYYFNHIFNNVHILTSSSTSDIFEQLFRIDKDDVFIGISFPRYSKRTLTAMRFVVEKNAKTIAITDGIQSPISELANYHLYAKSDMTSFVDSLVAPMSLINALIIYIGLKKQKQLSNTFFELEKIWDKYDIYAKSDKQ